MHPHHFTFQEFVHDLRKAVTDAARNNQRVTGIEISRGTEEALGKATFAEIGDVAGRFLSEGTRFSPRVFGYHATWDAPATRLILEPACPTPAPSED